MTWNDITMSIEKRNLTLETEQVILDAALKLLKRAMSKQQFLI